MFTQKTPLSSISLTPANVIEYEYRIQGNANSTTYTTGTTTYTTLNQFAIKIVLLSDNTVYYPEVYDLRAIALPGAS